jgi:selenocysteine-specific elongation factor
MEKGILHRLDAAGLQPPSFKELVGEVRCREDTLRTLLEYLAEKGSVLKISEDLYFHPAAVERLKHRLVEFLKERGEIQTQEFKALSDTTRKYTIPLLEYFDRLKITLRLGDRRVLRDKKAV